MTFQEVKVQVANYLHYSGSGDPTDVLNAHFTSIPEESRIEEAEELLTLLVERTARPQTRSDMVNSGSVGVIATGMPYAYPLLLTVLGWWVGAVYHTGTVTELTTGEKLALHKHLNDGIFRWDWRGYDANQYNYLLDRLVPPEPQPQSKPARGILQRLKLLF